MRGAAPNISRAARGALAFIALSCAAAVALLIARDIRVLYSYRDLAQTARHESRDAKVDGEMDDIDWDALHASGCDATAWLRVEGTPIDYPVMDGGARPSDWYLSHDAWEASSELGVPYIDARSDADAAHVLVYGHRVDGSALMFGPLADAWLSERFQALGTALWSTPNHETIRLEPLCALEVDASYARIQRFSFSSQQEIGRFAQDIASMATARTTDWIGQAEHADRILTLITCSEAETSTTKRTVVLFTA